jgi:hypothetical protein
LVACGAQPKRPTTPARADVGWKTMRAEHNVSLDVTKSDGTHDKRRLRGALAAERPGKFRLRALGPAGITLFDLLVVDGRVKVMEAIKDPRASALGQVIASLAGDLSAALLLEPAPAGRTVATEDGRVPERVPERVIVREPERVVTLSRFVAAGGHAVPTRIEVDNAPLHYHVEVDVGGLSLDEALDPALFAE